MTDSNSIIRKRQEIVSKLTQARLEKGLSQAQLAEMVGTQRSNICRIENGGQNLSLDLLIKITDALGKDISVLLKEKSVEMSNVYHLKLYDDILVTFTLEEKGLEGLVVEVLSYDESKKHLLPINMELTPKGIIKWLSNRVIPKNRAFVDEILKTFWLSVNDTKGIIDICLGLSLNDSYWVTPVELTANLPITIYLKIRSRKRYRLLPIRAWVAQKRRSQPLLNSQQTVCSARLGGISRMTEYIFTKAAQKALQTPEMSRTASFTPVRLLWLWA